MRHALWPQASEAEHREEIDRFFGDDFPRDSWAAMILIRESVAIDRSPAAVWQVLDDPHQGPLWNPKIQGIDDITWGERSVGFRYRVRYRLGRREHNFSAEVTEYLKPSKLVVRLAEGGIKPPGYLLEIYELDPFDDRAATQLTQTIDLYDERMPWYWVLFARGLQLVGKPIGKRTLVRFKELVESRS